MDRMGAIPLVPIIVGVYYVGHSLLISIIISLNPFSIYLRTDGDGLHTSLI